MGMGGAPSPEAGLASSTERLEAVFRRAERERAAASGERGRRAWRRWLPARSRPSAAACFVGLVVAFSGFSVLSSSQKMGRHEEEHGAFTNHLREDFSRVFSHDLHILGQARGGGLKHRMASLLHLGGDADDDGEGEVDIEVNPDEPGAGGREGEREEEGVPVMTYDQDDFPSFFTATSGLRSPLRVDTAAQAASVVNAQIAMDLGGSLVAVPIPSEDQADAKEVEEVRSAERPRRRRRRTED